MASKHDLDVTYGSFQMRGVVVGCGKETFYKETKTKTNKDMRTVNFGLQIAKDMILYVTFNGMPQKEVYYNGKDKDGNKTQVKVAWDDRYKKAPENHRMMGVNVGLEKTTDEKGYEVNAKRVLTPFDAALYVKEHLQDGMSCFVKGNIEYGHYVAQNGETKETVKFIPNQISLCQQVDFDGLDKDGKPYQVVSDFEQKIVFTGIEKDEEEKDNFVVFAKIVRSDSIESTQFKLKNQALAKNLYKVKPFTALQVNGEIQSLRNVSTVENDEEDDGWGTKSPLKHVDSPYRVIRLITGADKDSLDWENYTEEKIEKALSQIKKDESKEKAFDTKDDGWGSLKKAEDEDDDIPWGK